MMPFVRKSVKCTIVLYILCVAAFAQQQYYTGDGGRGIRIAVLEPTGKGLSDDERWMPSLVQGSITGDFSKYSAMTVIDRQNLEKIFKEWEESMSGHYSDSARVKIGNLTQASHILTGSISKTKNTFMLELSVTDVASGVRKASYSPMPVSPSALEDLSAIKTASTDLLRQLGVDLTSTALGELRQAVTNEQIQGQTMLARGISAQRQGTEVAALSYFYQAAAFDPSLVEASSRSSVMVANISSGNIGEDARNDIAWRKSWIARLKETEETFHALINAADPPYSLHYSTAIRRGNINYQKETLDLSIDIILSANKAWFNALNRSLLAADAVLDGLNTTNRKKDWGLSGWPGSGVSNTNPFQSYSSSKRYEIKAVFELVNEQGRAIGSQTVKLTPSFNIRRNNNDKMTTEFTEATQRTVDFNGVRANDISDNLTIRIASVNGAQPQDARFTISAISVEQREPFVDTRDGSVYNVVKIGDKTWMAENLNYQPRTGRTWCYDNDDSNCRKYGRLYAWGPAKTVCPAGWRLPSQQEWKDLIDETGGSYAGKNLKSSAQKHSGTDMFGFSALLGGYCYDTRGTDHCRDADREGYWWTATEGRSGKAYRRTINYSDNVGADESDMGMGLSVRCLQDVRNNSGETETGYALVPEPIYEPAKRRSSPVKPSLRVNNLETEVRVMFSPSGDTQTLYVDTDGNSYNISDLPEWCSANKSAKSFTLTCAANQNSLDRNGRFSVTSGGKTVNVTVSQFGSGKSSSSRSNNSSSKKSDRKSKPSSSGSISKVTSKPFDPTALYFSAGMTTVDSRDYGDKEYSRNSRFWWGGIEGFGAVETRNTFGMGFFVGGGTLGDDIWGGIFGIKALDLFWLASERLAVPISFGFDWRPVFVEIEKRVAANFIDKMSAADKISDSKIDMKMHFFDFTPEIGLQLVIIRDLSLYVGYAYNLSIPTDWTARYKIPGKSYQKDDKGDSFDVPDEFAPLHDVKEHFLGVPGTLRLDLKIHVNN